MLPMMEMMSCPHLAVSAEVMQHIVQVESSANPFAIGVVGGVLVRQPKNLDEAVATVQMLDTRGYDYSLGLAQVNRANLGRYGLDSYAKAFDACGNLSAGAHILADCYASAHEDWGKAFSCYYSGNFVTGFRDGYVKKVYASIKRGMTPVVARAMVPQRPPEAYSAISIAAPASLPARHVMTPVTIFASGHPDSRVALRSMAIDPAAAATAHALIGASRLTSTGMTPTQLEPGADAAAGAKRIAGASVAVRHAVAAASATLFRPQVSGPDDLPTSASASAVSVVNPTVQAAKATFDRADRQQEVSDAAFVF